MLLYRKLCCTCENLEKVPVGKHWAMTKKNISREVDE